MNAWIRHGLICSSIVALGWSVRTVQGDYFRARDADRYEEKQHHDKCVAARVLFFEECLKLVAQRPECEALWSQKRGIVFDGDPDKPWTDEVDCSKEIK